MSVQSRVKSSLAEGIFMEPLGRVLTGFCSCFGAGLVLPVVEAK